MAVFYTDFQSYTLGANPSGWSGSMGEGTATWLIVANETTGLKELRLYIPQAAGVAENFITYDSLNSGNASTNVETLAKVRVLSDGNLFTLFSRWNVNAASPSYYATTSYMLPNYDRPGAFLRKAVAGTETDLSANTYLSTNGAKQGWHWIRTRVNGTTLQYRSWKEDQAEPSGWATVTDSSVSAAGASGILFQRLHVDYGVDTRIGYYAIGTNGDSPHQPLTVQDMTLGMTEDEPAADVPGSEGSVIYGGWGSFFLGSSYPGSGSGFTQAEIGVISPYIGITMDSVTLVEDVQLTVQDMTIGTTVDSPLIVLDIPLLADDMTLGLSSDNVVIDATVAIALPDEMSFGITMDTPSLTQRHHLVVQDMAIGTSTDSPALTQDYHLIVTDMYIGTTVDTPNIIQDFHLLVQDMEIGLTPKSTLVLIGYTPGDIGTGTYTPEYIGTPGELVGVGSVAVQEFEPQAVTPKGWEEATGPTTDSWNSP